MAEEFKLGFLDDEEDSAEEVGVDELEVPDDEAERLLNPPPPPPPPPATKGAAARNVRAARKEVQKQQSLNFREILFRPQEWVQAATRFVLYSGMTRNNPLIATIRLNLIVSPMIFSMGLSYYTMIVIMDRGDKVMGGSLLGTSGDNAQVSVSGRKIDLPLPEDMETISLDEYFANYPMSMDAAQREGQKLLFAARPIDPDRRDTFFISAAVGSGPATTATSLETFQKELKRFKERKDNQGALLMGSNNLYYPYDETERSISYGIMLRRIDDTTIHQYSTLIFTRQNRPVIINVGHAYLNGQGEAGFEQWCQKVLTEWRDKILAQ